MEEGPAETVVRESKPFTAKQGQYRYLFGRSPVFRNLGLNPAFRELLGRIKARSEQFVP